jgi:hypothetical protein
MRTTDDLDRYVARERMKPFAWGTDNGDCLLFLLGWAERLGHEASHQWRGAYSDEAGARAALEAFGGAPAAVSDVLGDPIEGRAPQRGEVGLLAADGWYLGMICTGKMWVLRAGIRGVRFSRRPADIVWATGY